MSRVPVEHGRSCITGEELEKTEAELEKKDQTLQEEARLRPGTPTLESKLLRAFLDLLAGRRRKQRF